MRLLVLQIMAITFIAVAIVGCRTKEHEQQVKPKPTSIHQAAMVGDINSLEEFLKAGVDINAREKFSLSTSLHFAATEGQKEIAQILVTKGADVNATNKNGITPLMCAMMGQGDCKEVAEFLIAHGANINAKDSMGKTSLHVAILNGQSDMVILLLAKGADVNVRMNNGETPLDFATSLSKEHFRFGSPMAAKKKAFGKCAEILRQHQTR
jgi:ankyrin repeat protein